MHGSPGNISEQGRLVELKDRRMNCEKNGDGENSEKGRRHNE